MGESGYVMENCDPVDDGDAMYGVGERVTLPDDAEMYAGEEVVIVGRARGRGPFFGGNVVYDVTSASEVDRAGGLDSFVAASKDDDPQTWRFTEQQIEGT